MYCSLILRDFTFIEHYFFDKIVIVLTKLSATIWFKLLESAYNNILPWLFKFPQNRRNRNPSTIWTSKYWTTPDGLQSLDRSSGYSYFALFYFAGAVLVWTIYFLNLMHYRNSVLSTASLLSEFHSSAMQIALHLMRIWGIYTLAKGVHWRILVATCFGGSVSIMSCQVKVKSSF